MKYYSTKNNRISRSLIWLVTGMLLFTSCTEWLEVYPTNGLIEKQFWHTKEDIEAVLMGAYRTFADMDDDLLFHGELRADMISYINNTPNNLKNIKDGIIEPDNNFVRWDKFYQLINYCNLILANAADVLDEDQTFSEIQLTYFQSEALFLRGLAYFYLVRIFNNVPYITEPTKADDSKLYYPNVPGDSILTAIDNDLKQIGRNSLPIDYGSIENNKGRARYITVQALLADIALWQFRYNDCLEHIRNVEQNSISGLYLMPNEAWTDIFFPGNSEESVFEFQFSDADAESNELFYYTYGTGVALEVSDYAIEVFSSDFTSPRLLFSKDKRTITKYALTNAGSLRSDIYQDAANFIIYRYADLVLMQAEALAMLERYDEAEALINIIHRRSNPLLNNLSIERKSSSFEDAILNERAKEFAFEGKRWFDLLRMGRRNNYLRRDIFIERITSQLPEQDKIIKRSRLKDENGWYLPIHFEELENNPLLIQNPFYASFTQ